MSTTMTMTLPSQNTIMSTSSTSATTTLSTMTKTDSPCCPNCGLTLPPPPFSESDSEPHTAALLQAQREISDLQAQVRLLNQKATAAVDRWADYEDELSRLRAASTSTNNSSTNTTSIKNINNSNNSNNNRPHTPDSTNSPRSSFLGAAAASRISQLLLLSPRRSATSTPPPTSTTRGSISSPALPLHRDASRDRNSREAAAEAAAEETRELISALTSERQLRLAAEEKLAATSREVEDLSASLFEQANHMVATERRARAALEEQLGVLKQKDAEKHERIGRLEGAVRRIERVRDLLEEKVVEEEEDEGEGEGEDDVEKTEHGDEEVEKEKVDENAREEG
ncbi:hypothetical protein HD806DRAFT_150235 [Xylariaceae sp. AK1471]|nr:hypothetical protein HD806DRAFT_150235 [Xylariaceae sp. AK1471]